MKYHLKLIRGMSYTTLDGIIHATRKKPDFYTDDEAVAQTAVETGYFELVESSEQEQEIQPEQEQGKTLDDMTVAELETCATYYGVSLKGLKTKSEKISAIKAELGDKADGIVNYESPTMTELQTSD